MARPPKPWFREQTGYWMVYLDGEPINLSKDKDEADRKFHELMAARHEAPESPTARVADIVESFLEWASENTKAATFAQYKWYGQKLSEHSGTVKARDFKPIHVTRWVQLNGWKGAHKYNAERYAYRFFSWAVSQGIVSKNPLQGMPRQKPLPRQRAMTDAEYVALFRASDRDLRLLLFALRHTGARPQEMRELTWDQVRKDHLLLHDHKTVGKTRKPRVIHLSRPLQRLLKNLRRRSVSDHVFKNSLGRPWSANALRLRVSRLKEKLGLDDDVCAYLLRHAFGSNAIVRGVDLATVAELMGHSSTEMASTVYVHLAEQKSHLQEAVAKVTSSKPRGASRGSGA